MTMKNISRVAASAGVFAILVVPVIAGAQFGEVDGFFERITNFINNVLVPFVIVVAFLIFIIGVVRYFVLSDEDDTDREKARDLMLYGIGGLVLITIVWGVVNLLGGGFGELLDQNTDQLDTGLIPKGPDSR